MRHALLEQWSRGRSAFHRLDARAKLIALLAFLVAVATAPFQRPEVYAAFAALLLAAGLAAGIPPAGLLWRAGVVLPFTLTFAAMSYVAGDPQRAFSLIVKSYLSALAVLILVAGTPLPKLLRGLESLGAPRFLILVVQFLYRYLFVIAEQALGMRSAAVSRASESAKGGRLILFRGAAGALSVLFARSYKRAEGVHRAMLARAFTGRFPVIDTRRPGWSDFLFAAVSVILCGILRYAASH